MYKSFSKKVVVIMSCILLLLQNVVYADTVIIGAAPGSGTRTMDPNSNTQFLQNQFTGPGLLPNSATTGTTPIQGIQYDTSAGQTNSQIDNNGVANSGPTTTIITSPAANMAAQKNEGTSNVITNNAVGKTEDNSSTSDSGPTVHEILSPTADGSNLVSEKGSGPGYNSKSSESTSTTTTTTTTTSDSIPSYTTNTTVNNTASSVAYNSNAIVYQPNDRIQAIKPNITAPSAIVVNATTRQIYYSKGGFTNYHPASLVNLVTASVLLSYKQLDDVLVVSQFAVSGLESGATRAGLKAGDVITVRDAIGAMFVKSCCDVANVVAENVAGSVANFVNIMNQTAKDWGCVGTVFTNPTGLNSDAQVTNSYDMAIIMDKVSSNPVLKLMLQQSAYPLPATAHRGAMTLVTSNQLLKKGNKNYYNGISASRMGYTSKARYTMASELDYNGQRIVAVVLGANGSQYNDTTKLLNYAKVASLEAATQTNITYNASAAASVTTAYNVNQSAPASIASSGTNTAGTWQQDSTGWYFIKSSGQRANNEWIRQSGKVYCIDSTGYMVKGWKQMSNGNTYYFDKTTGELKYNTWINLSTGAYYLQSDGVLAKASPGTTKNIVTSVGTYTINDTGKAIAKVS